MEVYIEKTDEHKVIEFKGTAGSLLGHLGINPEEALVVRGHELLSPEDHVYDTDKIRILSVISGG
jgi:sulfur carrier protein ThiS